MHIRHTTVPHTVLWIVPQKLEGVLEEVGKLVKSFHEDMKARVKIDGELLEEIKVTKMLVGPTFPGHWLERIRTMEGVGTLIIDDLL